MDMQAPDVIISLAKIAPTVTAGDQRGVYSLSR